MLKDTLQWDPAIDVLLNRLPTGSSARPGRHGERVEAAGRRAGRNLDENDAFVIFPEGGNFTPHRRKRRSSGCAGRASDELAGGRSSMQHVMAPKPGGVLAALDPAPTPTSSSWRTPAWTRWSRCWTSGVSCRWTSGSRCGGGSCRPPRCRPARGADRLAVRLVGTDRRTGSRSAARGPSAEHGLVRSAARRDRYLELWLPYDRRVRLCANHNSKIAGSAGSAAEGLVEVVGRFDDLGRGGRTASTVVP